jgi:outer membrane biosynthesis protein TonB
VTKLPALTPDDPLRAATPAAPQPEVEQEPDPTPAAHQPKVEQEPAPEPTESPRPSVPAAQTPTGRAPVRRVRRTAPAAPDASQADSEWSGSTDVTTVRVPVEVLRLLRRRSRELGLPIGMILASGLVDVLAAADEDLIARVDVTQARYDQARRRASRAA